MWGPTHRARGASPDPLWVRGRVRNTLAGPPENRCRPSSCVSLALSHETAHKKREKESKRPRRRIQASVAPARNRTEIKTLKLRIFETWKKPGGHYARSWWQSKWAKRLRSWGDIPEETRENTNRAWVDEQQKKMSTFHRACVGCAHQTWSLSFQTGKGKKKKHNKTHRARFGAFLYTYKLKVDLCQLPGNRKDRRANKVRTIPLPASLG